MATSWKLLQSYTATCSWACSYSCSHSCSHLYLCKQLQEPLQARLPTLDGKISCQQHGNNSCICACSHSDSHSCSCLNMLCQLIGIVMEWYTAICSHSGSRSCSHLFK